MSPPLLRTLRPPPLPLWAAGCLPSCSPLITALPLEFTRDAAE